MSTVPYWLQKQRKPDLQALAAHVGVKNYDKLLKLDLEEALNDHLRKNQTRLEKDPMASGFYKRLDSPVKRERDSGGHVSAAATSTVAEVKKTKQRRQTLKAREELEAQSDSDNAPQATPGASLALATTNQSLTPHTPPPSSSPSGTTTNNNNSSLTRRLPLPASPSLLADRIEETTSTLTNSATTLYASSPVPATLNSLRQSLSSVTSIQLLTLFVELAGLLAATTPMKYATTFPAVPALGLHSPSPVKIPDLFAMLTLEFWGPVLVWLATSILLPAAGAWFWNLRGVEEGGYDPVAFGVVKALGAWIVFLRGGVEGRSVAVVQRSVPGGAVGLLVGSGVGVLAGVYEAVLRK
ncbi:MAG: hypothetical protein Q9202_004276 [Teloschistes flavicans]